MRRDGRYMRLLVIYPAVFTKKERFVNVETVKFEAEMFVWGSICQSTKIFLKTLAVLWQGYDTGSRQERKLQGDTKMTVQR